MSIRVLIVEDDAELREAVVTGLQSVGYETGACASAYRALQLIDTFAPDLLVADLSLPGMSGLELIERVRTLCTGRCILMTGHASLRGVVDAFQAGVGDYLEKPFSIDRLLDAVGRLAPSGDAIRRQVMTPIPELAGTGPAMRHLHAFIRQAAECRASVLLLGESGTGKTAAARAIHRLSARAAAPFVSLPVSSLSPSLLESELFGHERGSFTGASARRIGHLEKARGGTLFLDEIGEIAPATQVKLLRFLQDHRIERVGGQTPIELDVRILAATHRELASAMTSGRLRPDFYYRLAVLTHVVPPLRERREDIPTLATEIVARVAAEEGRSLVDFSDDAMHALVHHAWPGNIRELENVLQRATIFARGPHIERRDLPADLGQAARVPVVPGATLAELRAYAVRRTLEETRTKAAAARVLGISVATLQHELVRTGQAATGGADACPLSATPARGA